jgi:DnaK suppressor protein
MAQKPRKQGETDARRIGSADAGKLDTGRPERRAKRAPERETRRPPSRDVKAESLRDRLQREYDDAVRQLRELRISPEINEKEARSGDTPVLEVGDAAQANERQEMGFATRQRVADRINRLARALERLGDGSHGTCSVCGNAIEPARLAAVPEVDTCLKCQENIERSQGQYVA